MTFCREKYIILSGHINLAQRMEMAQKNLETAKCGDTPRAKAEVEWYSTYLEYVNKLDRLESEYTRLTIELSK